MNHEKYEWIKKMRGLKYEQRKNKSKQRGSQQKSEDTSHLQRKIADYNAKLDHKKERDNGLFKAKEQSKISREHGRWDNKVADFSAREKRWDMKWDRRTAEQDKKSIKKIDP